MDGKLPGQLGDLFWRGLDLQTDDETVADPAERVVVAVEADDFAGGLEHVVSDQVQVGVLGPIRPRAATSSVTKRSQACQ